MHEKLPGLALEVGTQTVDDGHPHHGGSVVGQPGDGVLIHSRLRLDILVGNPPAVLSAGEKSVAALRDIVP